MNLQEFAALKVGDKIDSGYTGGMNSAVGTVSKITPSGVHIVWDGSTMPFFYSVSTTAWMHWTKAEKKPVCQMRADAARPGWLRCDPCGSYWVDDIRNPLALPATCVDKLR